ncbi:unnamed protein product [Arabidopsis thaliana]|uniref:Uncharacterized protein n=1 Tax=Arabidopsis thaliana TaxID=3702 RepID=A0A654EIY4_ARATH|nr:unnamed protein product [Arabidopsis thaliana]
MVKDGIVCLVTVLDQSIGMILKYIVKAIIQVVVSYAHGLLNKMEFGLQEDMIARQDMFLIGKFSN